MSGMWTMIGVIVVVAIISDSVVKIIKAAKSGGGKGAQRKFDDFETDMSSLEQELADVRERIIVLEKIVTDEKYDLGKQIDGLRDQDSA